jgi:hypothetical protein
MPALYLEKLITPVLLLTFAGVRGGAQPQTNGATAPQIAGVWRGHSECVDKDSSCRDEVNVYRFTEIKGKPGRFLCAGSKVVDGKEVPMGDLEWVYDIETKTLESDNSGAIFRLIVKGTEIEGNLTLPNHKLYRRIYLKKED